MKIRSEAINYRNDTIDLYYAKNTRETSCSQNTISETRSKKKKKTLTKDGNKKKSETCLQVKMIELFGIEKKIIVDLGLSWH